MDNRWLLVFINLYKLFIEYFKRESFVGIGISKSIGNNSFYLSTKGFNLDRKC